MSDVTKAKWERTRRQMARRMQEKFDRVLPLDEMLLDRWKKAEFLGFGEKASVYENVYVYGKPEVGRNVWVGPFVILDASGGLRIGDGCDISCGVMIFTHSTHLRCVSKGEIGVIKKPVEIGNYVYLGSGATILPGVSIGNHSVVGAGAVVTKNVPAFSVAMGVPAQTVGKVILDAKHTRIEFDKESDREDEFP